MSADRSRKLAPTILVALLACAAVLASALLPWVVAGVGTEATTYSGFEVLPLAFAELLAVAATSVLATAALLLRRPRLTEGALVAAAVAVAVAVSAIVVLEGAATTIPDSALPATLRRNGLDLGAGSGLWLAAGAGLVAIGALAEWRPRQVNLRILAKDANRQWALSLTALLALTVLFGWLRYRVWFDAEAAGEHLGLAAWASPWIGPLSLLAVWMMIVALALGLVARTQSAGWTAAVAGWLVTFLASVAIVAAGAIGGLADLAGGTLGAGDPDLRATAVAWLAFLVGLGAAAVGGWLVSLRPSA